MSEMITDWTTPSQGGDPVSVDFTRIYLKENNLALKEFPLKIIFLTKQHCKNVTLHN